MRKTAFVAAVAALMTATPALAAGGYAGVSYSNTDLEFFGSDTEIDTWQGEAAVGFSGGGWGAQLGGSFGNLDFDTGGDADAWALDGHVYWDGGTWRIGAVILHTDLDFGGGGGSVDETVYGIEAMVNTSPNTNIFASLTTGEGEFLADYDVWNLDVGGNFYASPNIRIGGYIGTGNVDFGPADSDTFSAGINGEFQPWAVPVSLTVGWNYYEAEDVSLETNAFRIGARWNFGAGTLQDRNNATPFATRGGLLDRAFGVR